MASSPERSPKKYKPVTRYCVAVVSLIRLYLYFGRLGTVKSIEPKFPSEERFSWQKPKFTTDTVYDLPSAMMNRSISFSCSKRGGMDELANPDAKKNSTGPGSYDVSQSYGFNSEYATARHSRFGVAPRQSMAMKTPSPGAVYNVDRQYWNGPEKQLGISFNCDNRKPLNGESASSNADMMWPKLKTGPMLTMGARFKTKNAAESGPGAIYDVHKIVSFKTGPSYSFGNTKHPDRFKEVGFLPELD
jgi:hypothetical protein